MTAPKQHICQWWCAVVKQSKKRLAHRTTHRAGDLHFSVLTLSLTAFLLCAVSDTPAATVIDVLAAYTPEARTAAGGTASITTRIDAAIAQANTALANSLSQTELRLVHATEIAYTESSNMQTNLVRLQQTSDGYMDSVHTLRNQYGADVVALLTGRTDTGGYAGMGYLMSSVSSGFAPWAFSVTRQDQALFYTFVHEVGHNLGCHHDPTNASGSAAYTYSYGHRFTDDGIEYRTIMAYSPGTRIGYFSNPSVNVGSTATGITDQRDNARTIRNTAATVAAFRATVYGNFQLTATALDNRIMLRWTQPTTIGYGTDLAHLRFSTNNYPAATNNGTLAYQGTINYLLHTNLAPGIPHFYSIWLSNDGTSFIIP